MVCDGVVAKVQSTVILEAMALIELRHWSEGRIAEVHVVTPGLHIVVLVAEKPAQNEKARDALD